MKIALIVGAAGRKGGRIGEGEWDWGFGDVAAWMGAGSLHHRPCMRRGGRGRGVEGAGK